jgi:membrane protein implicated in regulation of membrane protease activity
LWLKSLLAAVAAFLVTAMPLEIPPVLIWSMLAVSLGAIWFLAFKRFFGIISLALVGVIVLILVGQGLEVRQTTTEENFRRYAQSQGLKVDKVPDWVLGRHRRYEHFHTGEWLQTGVAALGLAFLGWVGLEAVRPRRRQVAGSDNPRPGTF